LLDEQSYPFGRHTPTTENELNRVNVANVILATASGLTMEKNKGTQYLIMLSSVHVQVSKSGYYPGIRTTSPSAETAIRMCFSLIVIMNIILSYKKIRGHNI